MRIIGMALWIGGLVIFAWAVLGIDPSVPTEGTPERVYNIGLQQQQLIAALAGLAAFVGGVIVHAVAEVIERLNPSSLAQAHAPRDTVFPTSIPAAEALEESEDSLMQKYGIARDGEKYAFSTYRYDRLADAIAYARRQEHAATR